MITDWKNKELWTRPFPAIGGRTPREVMKEAGNSTYDVDKYIVGDYADKQLLNMITWLNFNDDPMNPELIDFWRNYGKGIVKHLHVCESDNDRTWAAYVPLSAYEKGNENRKYPAYFVDWNRSLPFMMMESWGFVHLAAEQELIVIASVDGREDDIFSETLDKAIEMYPVDPLRVFITGHSFTACCGGRHGINNPRKIAGVMLSGSQYYGADSTKEQIAYAQELGMPLICVHGMNQSRCLLPFNVTPERQMSPQNDRGITTSTFSLLTSYAEQCMWRKINRCRLFEMNEMRNIQETSDDICEQKIGIPLDHTYVRVLGGINHYMGDLFDDNGIVTMRFVGVEGCPHHVPTYGPELSWEFFRHFSRDPVTFKSVYTE